MTRRLSPLDKEKKRLLTANESRASLALAKHRKICADCHPEANWPRRACAQGWELAKLQTRAANDLSVFTLSVPADQLDGQLSLW